jgi:hypothetical protein
MNVMSSIITDNFACVLEQVTLLQLPHSFNEMLNRDSLYLCDYARASKIPTQGVWVQSQVPAWDLEEQLPDLNIWILTISAVVP